MHHRVLALVDKSAWLLILPAVAYLFFVDTAMARTLLDWTAYALVLAGIAIIISRVTFPQVELTDLIRQVDRGNRAAATVVSAVILFVGIVILALVLWART